MKGAELDPPAAECWCRVRRLMRQRRRFGLADRREICGEARRSFAEKPRLQSRRRRGLLIRGDERTLRARCHGWQRRGGLTMSGHHRARDAESFEPLIEQCRHLAIACAARNPSQDYTDQPVSITHCRGRKVEAGGTDISGLDPIGSGIPVEQMVVTDDQVSAKIELTGRKITVFARIVMIE